MIVTVTPSAVLDIVYEIDQLLPGSAHRVRTVRARAGGKGVNVAVTLARLGESPEQVLERTDRLLYDSKSAGKNCITFG